MSCTELCGSRAQQRVALGRVDHVVGWRGHRVEVVGGVADPAERAELGHGRRSSGPAAGASPAIVARPPRRDDEEGRPTSVDAGDRVRPRRRPVAGRRRRSRAAADAVAALRAGRPAGRASSRTTRATRPPRWSRSSTGMGVPRERRRRALERAGGGGAARRGPRRPAPGCWCAAVRGSTEALVAARATSPSPTTASSTRRSPRSCAASTASSTSPGWTGPRPRCATGARFVATNADATYPGEHRVLPGAGSLVAAIATASGRTPEVAGKPEAPTAALVRARLGADGIMVGDRPSTDGLLATRLGWPFAMVLSGIGGHDPTEPVPGPAAGLGGRRSRRARGPARGRPGA